MPDLPGRLYVVATPIGNLADITYRAITVLKDVDLIAAEDTRHVRGLLHHYGINKKPVSLHRDNELRCAPLLLEKILSGQSVALVSDAGTPLISDPGLPLVRMVREADVEVIPVPGPCALIAALSVSGLPVTRFTFAGFLPRTSAARRQFFDQMANDRETWAVYESSHRILAALQDMAEILPGNRQVVIARELTKLHETVVRADLATALKRLETDENMHRGEFVIIVAGAEKEGDDAGVSAEQEKLLMVLLRECSTKTAVALAAEITGARKRDLYQAALRLAGRQNG